MRLHNHVHCPWRAFLRSTCMSDGFICQGLFWWCCPDLFRPFYSDSVNTDPCLSTEWAAHSEPDGARPAEPMLLGRLLAPLSHRMHFCTPPNRSCCIPVITYWLAVDYSMRWVWSSNPEHCLRKTFNKFVPCDMTSELHHLNCVTLRFSSFLTVFSCPLNLSLGLRSGWWQY